MASNYSKLIHVAAITGPKRRQRLFLRSAAPLHNEWWIEHPDGTEHSTGISASSVSEAIRLGHQKWRLADFQLLNCGFRYTLPERDEHGMNALFHQMIASYSTPNGIYFDEELGHNCFVQAASIEAREIWQELKAQNRV